MDDEIDVDNERHRREELERRAKRQKARDEKAASGGGVVALGEKERKRREHAARILGAQHHHGQQQQQQRSRSKAKPPSSSGRRGGSSSSSKHFPSSKESSSIIGGGGGGSSVFQSLFAERALGFSISFSFRNAPPRPPVGPIFVGLGLEGELQKWTKYKKDGDNNNNNNNSTSSYRIMGGGGGGMGMNAVEKNYHWKLHSDLVLFNGTLHRKVLPGCAMDYEGCYATSTADYSSTSSEDAMIGKDIAIGSGGGGFVSGGGNGKGMNNNKTFSSSAFAAVTATATALLPPEDEALIHWKGSLGDTAMELLTTKQDRARAAARLAISQGNSSLLLPPSSSSIAVATATATTGGSGTGVGGSGGTFRLKKQHHLQSRILDEKIPNFMKKTTYLTNDTTSVHRFTSLASTQVQRAKDMDMAMKEKKEKYNIGEMIEKGFREANNGSVTTTTTEKKKRKRIHPTTKQEVYALWDVPLLPDVKTWGHTFTHVVFDNPPRNITTGAVTVSAASSNKQTTKKLPTSGGGSTSSAVFKIPQLLNKAIVADVTKHASNARMECTVWVPSASKSSSGTGNSTAKTNTAVATTTTSVVEDGESPSNTATTTSSSSYSYYSAIQKYDLDVISLRDPSLPPVHHVWTIYLNKEDDRKSYAGYHVIGSRVQLSLGRPVIVGGGMGTNTTTTTPTSKVLRRNLKEGEKTELEMKMTLVDVDLAEKYGL